MLCIDAILFFLMLCLDQWTKYLAILHLKGQPPFSIIKGVLELQYLENTGSAFSMFQDKKIFLLTVSILFLTILLIILFRLPEKKKFYMVHILLSMMIAGGIGNMIDRFRFGYVVDFISLVLIHFPVFNIADTYVSVATCIIFFLFLFVFKEEDLDFLMFYKKKKES